MSKMSDINNYTRQRVIEYLHTNRVSLNYFAKQSGVLQPNLHVFINGKTLSSMNIEKVWKFLESRGIK